jgi:ribosome-associated translation inhibitor RaiA
MWRRMMSVTRRFNDPSPVIEASSRSMTASIDRLIADLDQRMATLDERTASLSHRISAVMDQAAVTADLNITQMKNIAESTETQRDSLQRVSATISTEVLPVINKLESTVAALENASQNAGGILSTLGAQLQQSSGELQVCLDEFNRANHNVAPEIEKRVARFEATISRLPDQIETTLTRLSPMSETIADAAMLSTANVEVMEQLARQITESLQGNRAIFKDFSTSNTELMKQAVDNQVERFRDLLTATIAEEAARVSQLSHEIGLLTETAAEVVTKLQHPLDQVTAVANNALADMDAAFSHLDQKIETNLSARVAELHHAASDIVSAVNREIESAAAALQSGLAASSSSIVEQVTADTSRFEKLIGEAAEQSANRVVTVIRDLPAEISHRMDEEIARVDVSLQGSVLGLSDHVQGIIDGIPGRLASVTRETIESLEGDLERSLDGVAQRTQLLSQQFRKNATETTEAVLENYVDFIFLALNRFRSEMEELNGALREELRASPPSSPERDDRADADEEHGDMAQEPRARITADAE